MRGLFSGEGTGNRNGCCRYSGSLSEGAGWPKARLRESCLGDAEMYRNPLQLSVRFKKGG